MLKIQMHVRSPNRESERKKTFNIWNRILMSLLIYLRTGMLEGKTVAY